MPPQEEGIEERIFIELIMSDRKLKASSEGSAWWVTSERRVGWWQGWRGRRRVAVEEGETGGDKEGETAGPARASGGVVAPTPRCSRS